MAIADEDSANEEPNFSDPESFVDDISDEELVGDILKQKPSEDDSAECVAIVDGIPKVAGDRLPKLKGVLSKIFSKFGNVISDCYPTNEAGETKGYMFIEFATKAAAEEAVTVINGYQLDKNHTFTANLMVDLEKYKIIDKKWEKGEPREYKDHGNLRSWLLNPDGHGQFSIQWEGGERIAVYSNTPSEPTVVTEKSRWSDTTIRWSPYGTFLATVHLQGIALWGGEKMEQIIKFSHPQVQWFDFSPAENYLVTYSPPKSKYTDSPDALKIWNLWTGELKRAFPGGEDYVKKWPHFKWTSDDKYFASLKDDAISVYDTATFRLLDKKSYRIDNVRDFQWSPTAPIFAYWVAEKDQAPGRVAVMKVPDMVDIRSKNMFNLADASIFWQKSGNNLAFKVDRYGKKKEEKDEIKYSNMSYNLEVFHMRLKDLPVSTQEMKEPIQSFAWDPSSAKFAVVHGDLRSSIAFYSVKSNPANVVHMKTLEPKQQVNTVCWAPQGSYVVLGSVKSISSCALIFVEASGNEVSMMNTQEHPAVSDLEWDPTGRYLVSYVSVWGANRGVDFGYMLWNFQGRFLQRRPYDKFCTFSWRPKPPAIITEEKLKDLKKNMKKYTTMFEEKDKAILTKASKEILEKRRSQYENFENWRNERRAEWATGKQERLYLRNNIDTDELTSNADEEETIEYMISKEEFDA